MQNLDLWTYAVGAKKYWLSTCSPYNLMKRVSKNISIVSMLSGVPCICSDLTKLRSIFAPLIVDNSSATFAHCAPGLFGADFIIEKIDVPIEEDQTILKVYLIGLGKNTILDKSWLSSFEHEIQPFLASESLYNRVYEQLLIIRDAQKRISDAAQTLAVYLNCHPRVSAVRYLGLKSDPSWLVASRYLRSGFGGIVDFQLCDGSFTLYKEIIDRFELPLASENTPLAEAGLNVVNEDTILQRGVNTTVDKCLNSKPWLRCTCADTDELDLVLAIEGALKD